MTVRRSAIVSLVVGLFCAIAAPATAAEGSIDHVQPVDGSVRVLYSIPGSAQPDLESLVVTVDGVPVEAKAELAADSSVTVRRTTILAIDTSRSMAREGRFEAAKLAATTFLDAAPDDVYVGIVTFASDVEVALLPTVNRAAAKKVVDGLSMTLETRLYDGVTEAVRSTGLDGQRSVLVLSDGRDTSSTPLTDVTAMVSASNVKVDVVALANSAADEALLKQISDAGGGNIFSASESDALSEVFSSEALALARQILVTFEPPADKSSAEATLSVSVEADGEPYIATAFVSLGSAEPEKVAPVKLEPVPTPRFVISPELMWSGLGAAAVAVLLMLLGTFGLLEKGKKSSVEDRVAVYSRRGGRAKTKEQAKAPQGVSASAIGFAQRALDKTEGFEAKLGTKLEAAGMSLKPAEWLLTHAGIAVGFSLLALLLTSGKILTTVIALVIGAILPWVYLGLKRSRRTKKFKSQLADTLQLLSGSLSAGLSLAQGVDTVVREGSEPMAVEFKRALVEARLGVELEDALESVGTRMESKDFAWVVMAIRIQREVGGNLAELLLSVAATIREREYLERQVSALSAEGRLSVWILGGLPPGFMLYLTVSNPTYLKPLISTTIGFVLIGVMAVLLVVGILWMKKLVKVEV